MQSSLVEVEKNIQEVMQFQVFSRSKEQRDFNLITDNNSYVQKWSILQVLVIMITTGIQVYFVKRLFEDPRGKMRSRI